MQSSLYCCKKNINWDAAKIKRDRERKRDSGISKDATRREGWRREFNKEKKRKVTICMGTQFLPGAVRPGARPNERTHDHCSPFGAVQAPLVEPESVVLAISRSSRSSGSSSSSRRNRAYTRSRNARPHAQRRAISPGARMVIARLFRR